jgi:manganese transport protein
MEGYLRLRINPWIRRLITRLLAIVPAVLVIAIYGEQEVDSLLVFSQVVLSMQLGFAIIPLIHFVSDKQTMGSFAIKPHVQAFAWLIAAVLVYLNVRMVINEAGDFFTTSDSMFWKSVIILGAILFAALLVYTIFFPLFSKRQRPVSIQMHPDITGLQNLSIPSYKKIAVALEFSDHDEKLLGSAIGQGKSDTEYLLIHVVESTSARLLGKESDDYETAKDEERMQFYIQQLKQRGFTAVGKLGFKNRTKEIVRIVKEESAGILVIGAHGHSGIKDWIYGETINSVRHELHIPVLIVNL